MLKWTEYNRVIDEGGDVSVYYNQVLGAYLNIYIEHASNDIVLGNTRENQFAKLPENIAINLPITGLSLACLDEGWTPYGATGSISLLDTSYGSGFMIRTDKVDRLITKFRFQLYIPSGYISVK